MLQIKVGWLAAKFGEKERIRDHENAATSSLVYQEALAPPWFQLKQSFVLKFTGDKSLVNPNLISKFKISTFFN